MSKNLISILVLVSLFFVCFSGVGMATDWSSCTVNCSTLDCIANNNTAGAYICLNETNTTASTTMTYSSALYIETNNQTLDCMGNGIIGAGSNIGIALESVDNYTIKNCIISDFSYNIQFYNENNAPINNTILNNTLANMTRGILINSNYMNMIVNNTFYNFSVYGISTSVDAFTGKMLIYNNTFYNSTGSGLLSSGTNFNISNNTIYNINGNGIEIGTAVSGNNYIKYNNITNCTSNGIYFSNGNNTVIENNTLTNNSIGIQLGFNSNMRNFTVLNNNIYNSTNYGVLIDQGADNNSVSGNIFSDNYVQLGIDSVGGGTNTVNDIIVDNNTFYQSNDDSVFLYGVNITFRNNINYFNDNATTGRGIYLYYTNDSYFSNNTVYDSTEGFRIQGSNDITIYNNTAYNCTRGIFFDNTNFSYIINNTAYSNTYGIYLSGSHNNTIENNTAYNTTYGIYTNPSTNNTITFNTAFNSTIGIGLLSSNNTKITNNTAYDNTYATYFNLSRSNTIQNNTARNSQYGVYLLNSTSNILSGNRAYNNSVSEFYSSNSSGNTMSDFRITTLSFLSIDMSGDLSFKEGNLTGVTMPTTYQNISKETLNITNSSSNAWTTINLTYNPSGISDESTIILAHYNGTDWETNTSLYTSNFSINETSNYIYANITDFSMYMIMSPVVAEEVTSTSTGGGGFPSTTYETDLDSVENFVLRISDAVFFPFRGNQHKLRILNMGVGSVYLEVSSDPVKINIASGETKNVDLDSDGTDDISIYLEKIENNKAYITVTAINTDESDDAVLTDETIEDVKEELDISEDDIEIIKQTDDTIELVIEIDKDELPIIYGIVALAFVFIVAGWYFYKKDKV